jgi:hypothetical protein
LHICYFRPGWLYRTPTSEITYYYKNFNPQRQPGNLTTFFVLFPSDFQLPTSFFSPTSKLSSANP